jgi:N-acetylglucosaminyl-diphospho-decaprenol L-rhamnosyltransferase
MGGAAVAGIIAQHHLGSTGLSAPAKENLMIAEVGVVIVGFRNQSDIAHCLTALSKAALEPNFDVFICENGGEESYRQLLQALVAPDGACEAADALTDSTAIKSDQFIDLRRLQFRARPSRVWVGCATENLGYAGGINAWLRAMQPFAGWKGVWILNPDTEPDVDALAALVDRAETAGKGMVGSTIVDVGSSEEVRCRGGLHWQRLAARTITLGRGEPLDARSDVTEIEAAMDSPSGASMYVTRRCIDTIGTMDERYFLFFEDLDWGVRAKSCGLGYARASLVRHKRGTTTGSAKSLSAMPRLSVYLEHRNGIHFVRKHFPWTLPIRIVVSFMYASQFLLHRAPDNFGAALAGVFAGLRNEVGRPKRYAEFITLSKPQRVE